MYKRQTKEYLSKISPEEINFYYEFLANVLYSPSYLSLEYVLSEYNIITEFSSNFTLITTNKTNYFSNKLGNFFYHTIKKELFSGFNIYKEGSFTILKASKLFQYSRPFTDGRKVRNYSRKSKKSYRDNR